MAAASERVFEFLNEEEEDQTVEHPADVSAVTGTVDFDHVQFGYNPDQTIIKEFQCTCQTGAEDCNRWADRRRKDYDGKASDAIFMM